MWNKRSLTGIAVLGCLLWAAPDPAAAGRQALDLLLARNFTAFSRTLTTAAKEKISPEFLRERVATELDAFGKPEEIGKPVVALAGTDSLVSFPVRFAKTTVNVQFTLDQAGMVAGLFFRPADTPLPPVWKRPPYSKPESFKEREITVGAGEWKLPGDLTVPVGKGPFAAVVLVHGPGPNDRDETIYSNRMFKDIAEGLASRGIAVLRYDKRTKVYGEKMSTTAYTLQQETIDDALAALNLARSQPDINPKRVFVLGHSLGGYAIPRIAVRDGKLAGAIFLAGNARPIEDVVLEQNEYMLQMRRGDTQADQHRLESLKQEVAKVKDLAQGANNPPAVLGLPSSYFLDLKNYDPSSEAKRLSMPMLFLQGERDIQITMQDFEIWKTAMAGRKNAAFHSYATLNHLFMPGEGPGTPTEYRMPGNVSAEVIDQIAKWLLTP